MSTSRLDPNSTRNPDSPPAQATATKPRRGGTAPDKPEPAAPAQDPAESTSPSTPEKISDWEGEGGSPGEGISSTKDTPPKESSDSDGESSGN